MAILLALLDSALAIAALLHCGRFNLGAQGFDLRIDLALLPAERLASLEEGCQAGFESLDVCHVGIISRRSGDASKNRFPHTSPRGKLTP
jgi:hypothetical protein